VNEGVNIPPTGQISPLGTKFTPKVKNGPQFNSRTGLPYGLFSNQKSKIWLKFGGSCTGRCWFILWTLGIVRGNLVYFSRFGILYEEKSGNPAGDQDGFRMWCNRRVACASGAEAAGSNPPEYKVEGLKIFFLILNFM
jgi:hypothetical protein